MGQSLCKNCVMCKFEGLWPLSPFHYTLACFFLDGVPWINMIWVIISKHVRPTNHRPTPRKRAYQAFLKFSAPGSKLCSKTGKTTIILNGVPGPWIQCQNRLRQRDPISPFLYIIFTAIMQQLIRIAFSDGDLLHPIRDDIPLAVLQYATGTLILLILD
jgi:hypothetical protein